MNDTAIQPVNEMISNLLHLPYWGNQQDEAGIALSLAIRDVLNGLKRCDCWCEMAIGNPMVTSHSAACLRAQEFLK